MSESKTTGRLSPELAAELAAFMPPGWEERRERDDFENEAYLRHAEKQLLQTEINDNINRAYGLTWEASLRRLKAGNGPTEHERDAARRWLFDLHKKQRSEGKAVDPQLDIFVWRSRFQFVTGAAAGEAARAKRKSGPKVKNEDRDFHIAVLVEMLRGGLSLAGAINGAAGVLGMKWDRIEAIYKVACKQFGRSGLKAEVAFHLERAFDAADRKKAKC